MKPSPTSSTNAWRFQVLLITACLTSFLQDSVAEGFSEPPIVIHGKAIHIGEGTARQIYTGSLSLTIARTDDPTHTVTKTVSLQRIGQSGELSYRIEIPQRYLPEDHHLDGHLATAPTEIAYRIESATIDEVAATPLDSAQSLLSLSFSNRAPLHRLDLLVELPQDDTDGDGLPDWWEELHGLNPNFAGDATSDADSDGLNALAEFHNGTDPNASNTKPTVLATSLQIPIGGSAGLFLKIIDTDTSPANLTIQLDGTAPDLTVLREDTPLSGGDTFTYEDVLAGKIIAVASRAFEGGTLALTISDAPAPNEGNDPVTASVRIEAYSPANDLPALWLDADRIVPSPSAGDPITEWTDASGNGREAYQPVANEAPTFSSTGPTALSFPGDRFSFLDDRGLQLQEFTALVRFNLDSHSPQDQTILNVGDFKLGVGGSKNTQSPESPFATHNGRQVSGPHLASAHPGQVTVSSDSRGLSLGSQAGEFFPSLFTVDPSAPDFPTIGASRALIETTSREFLHGRIHEMIVFDQALDPGIRTRAEEYQQSRWGDLLVWDYRDDAISLQLTGAPDRRNALSGGWGKDTLTGGNLDDTLRGGPGADLLTGAGGADRFHLFADHGDDTILDFSEAEGDVLDLTEIFRHLSGSPTSYLNFRTEIVRGSDNVPRVHSILELDHDGDGAGADQSVTFANQAFSNNDLPRLVGQGSIRLGGPLFETSVQLSATVTEFTEAQIPRSITVTRSGNLDSALEVPLGFTGSADIDSDYTVAGADGVEAVRSVTFLPGHATAEFTITPVADADTASEEIHISVLRDPLISGTPAQPLVLTLHDITALAMRTTRHANVETSQPGIVEISRTGDVSQALGIQLEFSGTAVNGQDYETLASDATFPAGASTLQVEITPTAANPQPGQVKFALIRVTPNLLSFRIADPAQAEVQFLTNADELATSFGNWREEKFPGDGRSDQELAKANDDADPFSNIFEYVRGSDPTNADSGQEPPFTINIVNGFVEITTTTIAGLQDTQLILERSPNLRDWNIAESLFEKSLIRRGDGRIDHVYRSKQSLQQLGPDGFHRLSIHLTVPANN